MPRKRQQGKHFQMVGRVSCSDTKRKESRVKSWNDSLQLKESLAYGLYGDHGRSRTFKENCCYILVMKACLKQKLIANDTAINLHSIGTVGAEGFMVPQNHIHDFFCGFWGISSKAYSSHKNERGCYTRYWKDDGYTPQQRRGGGGVCSRQINKRTAKRAIIKWASNGHQ